MHVAQPASFGVSFLCLLTFSSSVLFGATLEVGPKKPFARIEEAVAKAQPGDTVRVFPLGEGQPYQRSAVLVRTAGLTISGVGEGEADRVRIDGAGLDYSGAGRVPRAIFQFDPGADGGVLEGFELFHARNSECNGAGVRVNQANRVTVRRCDIHDNDMGTMSNGAIARSSGADQLIEFCRIHANGSKKQPGYNHNLYLGGTSVTLRGCEVFGSVTGHNVKSRAHYTRVEYCYVHDSANREFDLVDDKGNTAVPESDAVLLGNVIVKKAGMDGNKAVIHFGQDGKNDHQGTIDLVHNTIVTPYQSPVLDLTAPGAGAALTNNLIWDRGVGTPHVLVAVRAGAEMKNARGEHNWLAHGFALPEGWDGAANWIAPKGDAPAFVKPESGGYGLGAKQPPRILGAGLPWDKVVLPLAPGAPPPAEPPRLQQYRLTPFQLVPRADEAKPDLGAGEAVKNTGQE